MKSKSRPSATRQRRELGSHLFTLAVISDTHINQEEAGSTSPYACNKLANARARQVVAELNQLKPDFVLHLGDKINPVPHLLAYDVAAKNFRDIFAGLEVPLHYIPGNHDIGDKPVDWMPAGRVCPEYIKRYRKVFGRDREAFDHKGCHFVLINAQLLNSGLPEERKQRLWLERDLARNRGKRLFVAIHYPPFISDPKEKGSYDNIDEPARSWLMNLLARHRTEALYAGHVHNFFYNRFRGIDCHVVPAICFVRHDYAEFYRAAPQPESEYGRNDANKLGYFIVRVFEHGHTNTLVRLGDRVRKPADPPAAFPTSVLDTFHTREAHHAPVGVDLRHPWAELVEVPPSGALDEFERKLARNDYPILALWELGIKLLRVPLQDMENERVRARMADMVANGHRFTVYCYGVPEGPRSRLIAKHRHRIHTLEIVIKWTEAKRALTSLFAIRKQSPSMRICLSRLHGFTEGHGKSDHFSHLINHGCTLEDRPEIESFLKLKHARETVSGFLFRFGRESGVMPAIQRIAALGKELGVSNTAYIRFASGRLSDAFTDDLENANLVAEAVLASFLSGGSDVILDSFLDVDRGYYVRTGLVDRYYNPRMAGRVLARLQSILNPHLGALTLTRAASSPPGRSISFRGRGIRGVLILPAKVRQNWRAWSSVVTEFGPAGRYIDLDNGREDVIAAKSHPVGTGRWKIPPAAPWLLIKAE